MSLRAAVLTPPGLAAIATVRLMGPAGTELLRSLWQGSPPDFAADRLVYGHITDGRDTIDNVVAVADAGGARVDISCHGGPRVTRPTTHHPLARAALRLEGAGGQQAEQHGDHASQRPARRPANSAVLHSNGQHQ